jgi:FtsZ-binding cell division protein ZapB
MLRLGKWLLGLAIFAGLGLAAYQSGLELARSEVARLQGRLDALGLELRDLRLRNSRLDAELQEAREAREALQRRYEQDVPQGEAAALFALAQQRIAAGVPRARIEQVLRDAAPLARCEGSGTPRRFAIAYSRRGPANAGIELLDGLVRVVVSAPSPNADLATAANTVVTVAGQDPVTLTGLPQRHPVVLGNVELTLEVAASDVRGFAAAAVTTCRP